MSPKHSSPLHTPATVAAFSVGNRHYERRYNDCGKLNCRKCGGAGPRHPSHGPYWYLCVLSRGSWRRIYIGKDLDTALFIDTHGQVDWAAVKRGRPRKNYTETTNREVPGQGDLVGDFPDAATNPRAALPPGTPGASDDQHPTPHFDHRTDTSGRRKPFRSLLEYDGLERRTGAPERRKPFSSMLDYRGDKARTGLVDRRRASLDPENLKVHLGSESPPQDLELAGGHFSPAGDWIPDPEDPKGPDPRTPKDAP